MSNTTLFPVLGFPTRLSFVLDHMITKTGMNNFVAQLILIYVIANRYNLYT